MKEEMQKVRDLLKANQSSPRNQSVVETAGRRVCVTKRRILSTLNKTKRTKKKQSRPHDNDNQNRASSSTDTRQTDRRHPPLHCTDSRKETARKNVSDRLHAPIESMSFHPIQHGEEGGDERIDFEIPEWNANGIYLSPADAKEGGQILPVRIGLDFGTAYTKASIQVGEYFFFVDWYGLVGRSGHVLAGHLSLTDDGYRVGLHTAATMTYRDLKLPLLSGDHDSSGKLVPAAIFLAIVLRYCRAWLYQQEDFLALAIDRRVVWELNIGCPTGSFDDNTLVAVYKDMAIAAWRLSMQLAVSWRETHDTLTKTPSLPPDIGLEDLSVTPEFVAQIAGYTTSPQYRDDLHFLMDVGAGTLDLAWFIVGTDREVGESVYPILSSKVVPRGTHYLMDRRASEARITNATWSDSQPVPSIETLACRWNTEPSILKKTDNGFRLAVRAQVAKLLIYTKKWRYPKSKSWTDGVPVFLAGGGASVPVYQEALENAFNALKIPFIQIGQQAPEHLRSTNSATPVNFSRLTVAYGLAIDPAISGRIQPADTIASETPMKAHELNRPGNAGGSNS